MARKVIDTGAATVASEIGVAKTEDSPQRRITLTRDYSDALYVDGDGDTRMTEQALDILDRGVIIALQGADRRGVISLESGTLSPLPLLAEERVADPARAAMNAVIRHKAADGVDATRAMLEAMLADLG